MGRELGRCGAGDPDHRAHGFLRVQPADAAGARPLAGAGGRGDALSRPPGPPVPGANARGGAHSPGGQKGRGRADLSSSPVPRPRSVPIRLRPPPRPPPPPRLLPLAALLVLAVPALASAATPSVTDLATTSNTIWVVITAVLVLFMQAGFAMLEIGLSRMKNAGAVAAKILINLSIALLMFWAIGFSIAFGSGSDFAGAHGWFMDIHNFKESFSSLAYSDTPLQAQYFFDGVFRAVYLAIALGTMLDRTKFIAYVIFGVVFTGLIYPTVAHWTWGGGWLAKDGFQDFAGSSIVHLQGALAALAGTLLLG